MEYFLAQLRLEHLPPSLYPDLLKKKILVRPFIPGKMLKSKRIDLRLLKDFAMMRNALASRNFFDKNNIFGLKNYALKDSGFYRKELINNFKFAPKKFRELERFGLWIVNDFLEIFEHIKKSQKEIVEDYSKMPFEKQHQDFREDNILVTPKGQMLIDWGSSYGYGPFMNDVAPFLVNNEKAFKAYTRTDNICKNSTGEEIKRWLYLGLAVRFLELLRWRLEPNEKRADTKKHCKNFLEYEYETFKWLLK